MRAMMILALPLVLSGCFGGIGSSPTDCAASDPADPIRVTVPDADRFAGYCMELNSDVLHHGVLRLVGDDGVATFPEPDPGRYWADVRVQQSTDRWCADQAQAEFVSNGTPVQVMAEVAESCA